MNKKMHLICNAHIDPVWLWEWEEGAAETISTYRTAADLCDKFDDFIFCHNEAQLYMWVAEYDQELFKRIQNLVKTGRWHIMGGWFNQPDCNLPCGEAFVRQALFGRQYFMENFGVKPKTITNLDSFGFSRGLVQIYVKSGYDNVILCQRKPYDFQPPDVKFIWKGYDGSIIKVRAVQTGYSSLLGKAVEKISNELNDMKNDLPDVGMWGIGNHGGGPSLIDLQELTEYIKKAKSEGDLLIHSTPDDYFDDLKKINDLPKHDEDLNPHAPGCYTSQIRIKQLYRRLENAIFRAEKIASHAHLAGLINYPADEILDAVKDMLMAQFHDALPGTSIKPVEDSTIRAMEHGLEIMSRVTARAFFALTAGQKKPKNDEIPIIVYNPHPYEIEYDIECEFNLWDQRWNQGFLMPAVYNDEMRLPTQCEKEHSTVNNKLLDWRKRVVFRATLLPMQINMFTCRFEELPEKPVISKSPLHECYQLGGDDFDVKINTSTGLIDSVVINGVSFVEQGAFSLAIMDDNYCSWSMNQYSFINEVGRFSLLPEPEEQKFSSLLNSIPSVRVIEDGNVRTIVESIFHYENSYAAVRYIVPKSGAFIDINIRLYWLEKRKIVKLLIPTTFENSESLGEVVFGKQKLHKNGRENISQRHVIIHDDKNAIAVINDGLYGSSHEEETLKLSLIRSPGYSAHPYDRDMTEVMPQDRHSSYIDQGEREYNLRIAFGEKRKILEASGQMGVTFNQKPIALSFYPSGEGKIPVHGISLSDKYIELTAFKRAESGQGYILRLFNPTDKPGSTKVCIPLLSIDREINLSPYEAATFLAEKESLEPCSMTENW